MEQTDDNLPEELAEKWLKGSITPEQEAVFNQWYESQSEEEIPVEARNREYFRDLMLERIKSGRQQPHKRGRRVKYRWVIAAAAASVLIALGVFSYKGSHEVAADQAMKIAETVQPGGSKALLTLSDGQTIILDRAKNGMLANQGNSSVTKAETGLLVYKASSKSAAPGLSYNTLSTPRGGKYRLELPDGTKVWLNAASSIRYPTAFSGRERKVSITGEAYFEVVHNEKMPFRVQVGKAVVEDLGTQFVINSYDNEPDVKVSLLEGVVKVIPAGTVTGKVLKPGEQARVAEGGEMKIIKDADVQGAVAWKNGLFNFSGADLKTIMRQLERWYDITVVYAPGLPAYHFGGQTYMNGSLSEVLKVLELSGIHFRIEKGANGQAANIYIER